MISEILIAIGYFVMGFVLCLYWILDDSIQVGQGFRKRLITKLTKLAGKKK